VPKPLRSSVAPLLKPLVWPLPIWMLALVGSPAAPMVKVADAPLSVKLVDEATPEL